MGNVNGLAIMEASRLVDVDEVMRERDEARIAARHLFLRMEMEGWDLGIFERECPWLNTDCDSEKTQK